MIRQVAISKTYTVAITPMPAPRPRGRIVKPKDRPAFVSIYNPPEYMNWKETLARELGKLYIEKGDWNTLNALFFIPIAKSHSGKTRERMHGTLHEQKPDWDNYVKPLMDALQLSEDRKGISQLYRPPIKDDSGLSSGAVRKIWTMDPIGSIVFNLSKVELDPLFMMSLQQTQIQTN